MVNSARPKLAMYWAAACGGCEIAVLNIGNHLTTVADLFDIVFFPCIADFKREDVVALEDNSIELCLFDGAIRSSENEEMAHLLRQKSQILVAFGSCAYEGCIPALSNLTSKTATLHTVFGAGVTLDNPGAIVPLNETIVDEGSLELPTFFETVKALDQVVPVDYYVPGCPPEPHQIWAVLQVAAAALAQGGDLPPARAILGAGETAVCADCPLPKQEKHITRFFRPYEKTPEPNCCLLEQGFVCMGPATRSGCGALCPQVGMGCRGCYGPMPGVEDMGAKMIGAIASIIEAGSPTMDEQEIEREIEAVVATIPDPAGTFYRFNMAHALLKRVPY